MGDGTFVISGNNEDIGDFSVVEEIIDVPVEFFLFTAVPLDPGVDVFLRPAYVQIESGRKLEGSKSSDRDSRVDRQMDQQDVTWHGCLFDHVNFRDFDGLNDIGVG